MNKNIKLGNNNKIPSLGLGTWRSDKNKVAQAVENALKSGYQHIDCASIYGNEKEIGKTFNKVFSENIIRREDIFITSKLWNTDHHPNNVEKACRKTLSDLQLNYLDLYLIHWGIAFEPGENLEPLDKNGMVITEAVSVKETWQAMETLVEKGLVKSIGVANFTTAMLVDVLSYAKIKPVINQIEIHPYNSQQELVEFCHKKDVKITAYSPLGSAGDIYSKPISNKIIISIAETHKKSPAQILIRWSIQRGLVVIPKTVNKERIVENIDVFDFELNDNEMSKINELNKNHRYVNPIEWWGLPYFD